MKRLLPIALSMMLLTGCAVGAALPAEPEITPSPTPTFSPSPTPSPLPEPEVYRASVGIVGDILMMTSQIQGAKTAEGYDFRPSFYAMEPLFSSVDIMAGNFECTLAGEAAGYTQRRPAAPPPTVDDPNPKQPYQTFNAPDELAADLRAVGFDLLTTANNHCLDRGKEGLFRTIETLRAAGLAQTGTYLSEEERDTPCIMTAGGITFGFVAMTESVNSYDARLGGDSWAVGRVSQRERIQGEIEACRSAGAEVVIAFPHWGEQYLDKPVRRQREYAQSFADWGADAVIGSHPHCAEPFGRAKGTRSLLHEQLHIQHGGAEYRVRPVSAAGCAKGREGRKHRDELPAHRLHNTEGRRQAAASAHTLLGGGSKAHRR